ncbi:ATP-binding protein [Glaciecola sp. SC05]|uniref:hybrid sensor histidine kinase/response regulator n=1 Tax=Glaciecola sp. SC05 TaxID=1987355 RepID=UPI003526F574
MISLGPHKQSAVLMLLIALLFCGFASPKYVHSKSLQAPNMMVLLYEHGELPWNQAFKTAYIARVKESFPNANIFVEYVDAVRFNDTAYVSLKFEQLRIKYKDIYFDFAVVDGNADLEFESETFAFLGRTPKVIIRWEQDQKLRETPIRKVFNLAPDFISAIEHAASVTNASNAYVMHHQDSNNDLIDVPGIKKIIAQHDFAIDVRFLPIASLADAKSQLQGLPKNSIVMLSPFYLSLDDTHLYPNQIVSLLSEQSKVPIFVHWDTMIRGNAMGGLVISAQSVAQELANAGISVINGSNMRFSSRRIYQYIYNYPALEIHNIDPATLPADSQIVNRPENVFRMFTFTSFSSLFVVLMLVFVMIFTLRWNAVLNKQKRKLTRSKSHLLAINERLDLATSSAQIGIWEYDLGSKHVYWNEWMQRHHNIHSNLHSFNLDTWLTLVYEDDRIELERKLLHAIGRRQSVNTEYRVRLDNGRIKHFSLHAEIVLDDNKLPDRMLGTLSDITDQVEHEHLLEAERLEAETATRAKTEFLAGMSHEIRTPMNGVVGAADLLVASRLSDYQAKYANIIRQSATGLLRILNDILDLSKIESHKLRISKHPFDLPHMLIETIERNQAAAIDKQLKLSLHISDSAKVWISADSIRVQQIVHHLVENAIKFTEVGDVDVFVHISSKPCKTHGVKSSLEIEVKDTGIGILPEHYQQIFKGFVQSGSNQICQIEGAGLGLTISNQLLQLMKGTLSVKSQISQGSCFTIQLPVQLINYREPSSSNEKQIVAPKLKGKTILVVDDNAINHQILSQMLVATKAEILVAESGRQAIDAAKLHDIDVIFMDIVMPEMDGFEATRRIREMQMLKGQLPCQIISISADTEAHTDEAYIQAGIDHVLSKPLHQHQIFDLLSRLYEQEQPVQAQLLL